MHELMQGQWPGDDQILHTTDRFPEEPVGKQESVAPEMDDKHKVNFYIQQYAMQLTAFWEVERQAEKLLRDLKRTDGNTVTQKSLDALYDRVKALNSGAHNKGVLPDGLAIDERTARKLAREAYPKKAQEKLGSGFGHRASVFRFTTTRVARCKGLCSQVSGKNYDGWNPMGDNTYGLWNKAHGWLKEAAGKEITKKTFFGGATKAEREQRARMKDLTEQEIGISWAWTNMMAENAVRRLKNLQGMVTARKPPQENRKDLVWEQGGPVRQVIPAQELASASAQQASQGQSGWRVGMAKEKSVARTKIPVSAGDMKDARQSDQSSTAAQIDAEIGNAPAREGQVKEAVSIRRSKPVKATKAAVRQADAQKPPAMT